MTDFLWTLGGIALLATPAYVVASLCYLLTLAWSVRTVPKSARIISMTREARWGVSLVSHGLLGGMTLLMWSGLGTPFVIGSLASVLVAAVVMLGRRLSPGWRWVPFGYAASVAAAAGGLALYGLVWGLRSGDLPIGGVLTVVALLTIPAAAVVIATRFAIAAPHSRSTTANAKGPASHGGDGALGRQPTGDAA